MTSLGLSSRYDVRLTAVFDGREIFALKPPSKPGYRRIY